MSEVGSLSGRLLDAERQATLMSPRLSERVGDAAPIDRHDGRSATIPHEDGLGGRLSHSVSGSGSDHTTQPIRRTAFPAA